MRKKIKWMQLSLNKSGRGYTLLCTAADTAKCENRVFSLPVPLKYKSPSQIWS